VLYIEDNPSNPHLLERVVSTRGSMPMIPPHGPAGPDLAREHHPDLSDMPVKQQLRR